MSPTRTSAPTASLSPDDEVLARSDSWSSGRPTACTLTLAIDKPVVDIWGMRGDGSGFDAAAGARRAGAGAGPRPQGRA